MTRMGMRVGNSELLSTVFVSTVLLPPPPPAVYKAARDYERGYFHGRCVMSLWRVHPARLGCAYITGCAGARTADGSTLPAPAGGRGGGRVRGAMGPCGTANIIRVCVWI